MPLSAAFTPCELAEGRCVYLGRLPEDLVLRGARFDELWAMHPPELPKVVLRGEHLLTPRWHQAFGRDYEFAGAVAQAAPVPTILEPMLAWTRANVDERINGILVNWYDAAFEHRIAPHKDSPIGRIPDCPIVTVSLGAARTFQMFVGKRPVGFRVAHGDVIVIPDSTNRRHGHSVPHLQGDVGRRISVTLRGFE